MFSKNIFTFNKKEKQKIDFFVVIELPLVLFSLISFLAEYMFSSS